MKLPKFSPPFIGLLLGAILWSCVVFEAWMTYPMPWGWESAGFMLLFFGMPSSMLVCFYEGPVFMQILLMSIFGYLQWPAFGFLIGRCIGRRIEKAELKKEKS